MKNVSLIAGLIAIILLVSCAPNAEEILKDSFEKCQSIENGYYEMDHYMKYMSGNDTSFSSFNCYFKKLPDDSIYSSAFHYQHFYDGEYSRDVMYTGDDFISYRANDSTGEIMSKLLWAKDIKSYSHNYTFYSPFTNRKSYPLPNESDLTDDKNSFQLVGEEMINESPCFHVIMNNIPENDSTEMTRTIQIEHHYWINKLDFIPIQYTITYVIEDYNDTIYQFEKNVLTRYDLDNLKDDTPLSLSSVPLHIKLKDYVPYKRPELLPDDTIAPNWSLLSLKDETVCLSDLKGSLVLIDFFYKACHPCMLALPALQNLHEKYKDKGLRIIGIDPFDTKEDDDIENFLSKRGVTYTILLGGKDVVKEYHVYGYPTIYLIDKDGSIITTQVGYGEGTEDKLEEIIKENL